MPRRQERVVTKRTVDALSVEHRDAVFWDRDLPGFGIRVYPSGLKKYVVQSRGPGGSKRATLGRHGKLTADEARRRAAEAIDRIKRGEDPIPPPPEHEPTMAVLAERYMRDYVPSHCRASSAEVYRRALDNHILPALGGMRVGEVGREQVMELHYAMRGEPHAANAVLKIVAKMLSLAVEWGLREHGPNPCRAVRKYRTHPRERFLTGEEYCRLGRAVEELEVKRTVSLHAAAAIRLLVLTGCRRNEVLELRWDDIDRTAGELRLRDGKTGARMVPLTPAVAGVLEDIPRVPDNPWVIAGQKPGARMTNVNDPWLVVRARAGLDDVRIHDLRHSWASRALGARREPEHDREAAGPQQDRDHRALRASRARHREGLGGQDRRQHRRRHPAGGWRGGGVMAKLKRRSISRRTVEAVKVQKDTVFWDRDLPGFGIRVYASGTKMYVVQSRTKGKSVRVTVGRHGVISADEARRRAARIVNRIKAGEDPIPEPLPARLAGGPTVADLAARYMEKHVAVRCKESTAEGIRGLLDKYILPEFGKLPLLAVERERVAAFHVRQPDRPQKGPIP